MERLRLSISLKKEHRYIFEHLQTVNNKSDFVAKALDAYISSGEHSVITHEEIRKVVMEILQAQGTFHPFHNHPSSNIDSMISDDDIALISDLF